MRSFWKGEVAHQDSESFDDKIPIGEKKAGNAGWPDYFWQFGVVLLCGVAAAYFAAMNGQWEKDLAVYSLVQFPYLILLTVILLLSFSVRTYSGNRFLFSPSVGLLGMAAVAYSCAIHDPFFWDSIQTVGRSWLLVDGRWSELRRFSLTYAILGVSFKYLSNTNGIAHLYIVLMTILLLAAAYRSIRSRGSRVVACVLLFACPHIFVLSKWVYLDIPVITAAFISILLLDEACRKPGTKRYLMLAVAIAAACLFKEVGIIAAVPVALMPFLTNRKDRRRAIIATVSILALAVLLSVLTSLVYETQKQGDTRHVRWVLGNTQLAPWGETLSWFGSSALEQLRAGVWWCFLPWAFLSRFRIKGLSGYLFVSLILIAYVYVLFLVSDYHTAKPFSDRPISVASANLPTNAFMGFALILSGVGMAVGVLKWRQLARIEILSLAMISLVLFIFSATGKIINPTNGHWTIDVDWRYFALAIPFVILLAAKGIPFMLRNRNPLWFRILAATALSICLMMSATRGALIASVFSEKARSNGRAYAGLQKFDYEVVFTHWPYFTGVDDHYDYGTFTWKKDQYILFDMYDIPRELNTPLTERNPGGTVDAVMLFSEDHHSVARKYREISEQIYWDNNNVSYIVPFRAGIRTEEVWSNFIWRIHLEEPVHPAGPGPGGG